MRNKPPTLLPLLRSERMGRALSYLYLHEGQEFSLSELARLIGTSPSALHRDMGYLSESGFVTERVDGRSRKFRAQTDHPMARPLSQLLLTSFGPVAVITDELDGVGGIDQALLFGSWAARFSGEPGPFPSDVDVLIVGSPKNRDVHNAMERASSTLGMQVNATVISNDRWNTKRDPFVSDIRRKPTLPITTGG